VACDGLDLDHFGSPFPRPVRPAACARSLC
jgi:hypothetical protein